MRFQCACVEVRIGEEWPCRVENIDAAGTAAKVVLRRYARIDTWIRWSGTRHRVENF